MKQSSRYTSVVTKTQNTKHSRLLQASITSSIQTSEYSTPNPFFEHFGVTTTNTTKHAKLLLHYCRKGMTMYLPPVKSQNTHSRSLDPPCRTAARASRKYSFPRSTVTVASPTVKDNDGFDSLRTRSKSREVMSCVTTATSTEAERHLASKATCHKMSMYERGHNS